MGVRFACHACGQRLNIKSELAGRRGKCPGCRVRFRIPTADTEFSIPLEEKQHQPAASADRPDGSGRAAAPHHAGNALPSPNHSGSNQATESPAVDAAIQDVPAQDVPAQDVPAQDASEPPSPQQPDVAPAAALPPEPAPAPDPEPAAAQRRFALLDEDPGALWYVRPKSGGQYGPAAIDLLYEWIEQGRVSSSALLWRDGWAQWRNAVDVLPELDASTAQPSGPTININTDPAPPASPPTVQPPLDIQPTDATLAGDSQPGVVRSQRKGRRIMMISLLLAACLALVVALIVAIMQSS